MKAIKGDLTIEQQLYLRMVELESQDMTIDQLRKKLLETTKLNLQQEQVIKALVAAEFVAEFLRECLPTEENAEDNEPGFLGELE